MTPQKIHKPYTGAAKQRWFLTAMFLLFCAIYGACFTLLVPNLVMPLLVIPAILLGLAIWALPQSSRTPTKWLDRLLFALLFVTYLWPNYIAIELPGLPWITFSRLVQFPFFLVFLTLLSTSSEFRKTLRGIVASTPFLSKMVIAFILLQVLSIGISANVAHSIQQVLVHQIMWTTVFFASAYVFAMSNQPGRVPIALGSIAFVVCIVAILENSAGHVLWAGHIPSFLRIEDPSVQRMLSGGSREGLYRVKTMYSVSLTLSELMAMMLPFALWLAIYDRRRVLRIGGYTLIPLCVLVIVLSRARIGLVGAILTFTLFPAAVSLLKRRQDPKSLFWTAIFGVSVSMPVFFGAIALFTHRVRNLIFQGNIDSALSTQARIAQLDMGLPKILNHPWGYGIGQCADVLGYRPSPGGTLTIDSYWLCVTLDYGFLGPILWYSILIVAFAYSVRGLLSKPLPNNETTLFIPTGIVIFIFFVMKFVFSNEENTPVLFLAMGLLAALVHRTRNGVPDRTGAGA